VFIGTVHGFALSHVIAPYARCVLPELRPDFRIAAQDEWHQSVETAYSKIIADDDDPHARWRFAIEKRRRDVDRTNPAWRGRNPELADFIEAYEADLRRRGLIDFDDMPLIAFRMIQAHPWIQQSLQARFPILFVDEYQDLGHALHELVLKLCFDVGVRLFAVGDAGPVNIRVHWGQSGAAYRLDPSSWGSHYPATIQLPMRNQDHHCIRGCPGGAT
jgi:DNA helicase II / ATP-dependent DNA helicase PcrA